ncbi:ABC transporter ATP-binding protein [Kordiimonas sp. SCSIO 12603]|uniref:ABC transporter ATP-binding protein n=1 Tax=Kordiimonas sp. SCSIO 12603 TaxID=2829596 RepID=UPI0021041AC0|nr:ABC transporter ATP-binding protein [Kordiimonas sp. SCSIO 12603]UTW59518.1 ABC transporter ATP-binding protein [Kordiimonas sp. SCSIO 12603]
MGLTVKNIVKNYPKVVALQPTSFEVKTGELITIVGPSGCGKTTLLDIIAGFTQQDSGTVQLNSRDITNLPINKRKIAYVMDGLGLYPHLSVQENIAYPLKLQKLDTEQIIEKCQEVTQLLQIDDLNERMPEQLSAGQKQRVALARALVRDDIELLLADECFSDLDARLKLQVRKVFKHWQRKHNITCLFVTHDQQEALSLGDRTAILNAGKVEQLTRPQEVYSDPQRLFLAQFIGNPAANIISVVDGSGKLKDIPRDILGHRESEFRECYIAVRPENLTISFDNTKLAGVVEHIEYSGSLTLYHISIDGDLLVIKDKFYDSISVKDEIGIVISSNDFFCYNKKTENRVY